MSAFEDMKTLLAPAEKEIMKGKSTRSKLK